jgi:hypothetical protein
VSKTYRTENGRNLSADSFDTVYPHIKTCVACNEPSRTFDMLMILGEGVCVIFGLCVDHLKLPPQQRKEAVMSVM